MTRLRFRQLLLAICALVVAQWLEPFLLPGLVPEALRVAQDSALAAKADLHTPLFYYALIGMAVTVDLVAILGLYFFRRWSLWLSAGLIPLSTIATCALGEPSVGSWLSSALLELSLTGFGAALAIAWFSSLRQEFK